MAYRDFKTLHVGHCCSYQAYTNDVVINPSFNISGYTYLTSVYIKEVANFQNGRGLFSKYEIYYSKESTYWSSSENQWKQFITFIIVLAIRGHSEYNSQRYDLVASGSDVYFSNNNFTITDQYRQGIRQKFEFLKPAWTDAFVASAMTVLAGVFTDIIQPILNGSTGSYTSTTSTAISNFNNNYPNWGCCVAADNNIYCARSVASVSVSVPYSETYWLSGRLGIPETSTIEIQNNVGSVDQTGYVYWPNLSRSDRDSATNLVLYNGAWRRAQAYVKTSSGWKRADPIVQNSQGAWISLKERGFATNDSGGLLTI